MVRMVVDVRRYELIYIRNLSAKTGVCNGVFEYKDYLFKN